jgi:hypothetical protein
MALSGSEPGQMIGSRICMVDKKRAVVKAMVVVMDEEAIGLGGSSALSSAVLKSSETSVSYGGEDASLTPRSLLPLHMMERFGAWVVREGTGGLEREDELAVWLQLPAALIMD